MKIAVIGGTGLIGSQVVKILNASGHEAVPHSLETGLDMLTGEGLPEALAGADVVVNLINSPTFDEASPAFFRQTMENMLAAAHNAGVGHAVVLSIVGAELVPDLVYYQAKVLQEELLKAGPVPFSIVRATQFYEFMSSAVYWVSGDDAVRVPSTLVQPMAAADVAAAVAEVSAGTPLQGTRDVAGPEVFTMNQLAEITLAAHDDKRAVVVDETAGLFAVPKGDSLIAKGNTLLAEEGALTAKDAAVIAKTSYRDWLAS